MTYAIIGSGAIGTAIATHFARTGIAVSVANTRGPASLAPLVQRLGSAIRAADLQDALTADLIILAVPHGAVSSVLAGSTNWEGRIIVDATNAIDPATFAPADLGGRASTEIVSELAPGATVVKGFNHILARVLERLPDDGRGYGKRTQFVSGEDADGKLVVSELMQRFGFAVIDLGGLSEGGLLQQYGGPLTGHSLVSQEMQGSNLADTDIVQH